MGDRQPQDLIFSLRTVTEKTIEYNRDLSIGVLDLTALLIMPMKIKYWKKRK